MFTEMGYGMGDHNNTERQMFTKYLQRVSIIFL